MRTNRKQHRKPRMESLDSRCLMTASTLAELSPEPVADDLPADDPWVTFCLINSEPGEDLANCLDGLPSKGEGVRDLAKVDRAVVGQRDGGGMVMELDDDWCGTGPKIDIPLPGPIGPALGGGFDYYPNPEDDGDFGPAGPVVKDAISTALTELEAEDKLGNFEIQDLMSRFNQSESLSSAVAKKVGDTAKGVIQRVG